MWHVTSDKWHMKYDMGHMTHGMVWWTIWENLLVHISYGLGMVEKWHATPYTWHMTCDTWQVVSKCINYPPRKYKTIWLISKLSIISRGQSRPLINFYLQRTWICPLLAKLSAADRIVSFLSEFVKYFSFLTFSLRTKPGNVRELTVHTYLITHMFSSVSRGPVLW